MRQEIEIAVDFGAMPGKVEDDQVLGPFRVFGTLLSFVLLQPFGEVLQAAEYIAAGGAGIGQRLIKYIPIQVGFRVGLQRLAQVQGILVRVIEIECAGVGAVGADADVEQVEVALVASLGLGELG